MSLIPRRNRGKFFEDEWSVFDPEFAALVNSDSGIKMNRDENALAPLLTSDLIESSTDYHVYADLPGVDIKDLDVSIEGSSLVIKAERKHVHETGTARFHSMERSYGKVTRSISIPKNVDLENVETIFRNGVLSVSFPKLQPASTSRKLTVTH